MKTNAEFDRFTGFMDKLAKVPHSELKAELDTERAEKKLGKRHRAVLKEAKALPHMSGVPPEENPALQVMNEVLQKAARRKVN